MREENKEGARDSLQWVRGQNYDPELEMKELEAIVEQERREEAETERGGLLCSSLLDRTFLLPLVIVCTLFIIQVGAQLTAYPGSGEEVCRCSAGRTSWTPTLWSSSRDVGVSPQHLAILYQVR